MKHFYLILSVLCSFTLRAATLEVEITGVTKEGVLYLAIYSSKEAFESDRGDRPGPQPGIIAGSIKNIDTETYKETFDIPAGTYAVGYYIDANENEKLDTNFWVFQKKSTASLTMSEENLALPALSRRHLF